MKAEARNVDDEKIDVRWFTPEEVWEGIQKGAIQDGKTIIGLLMSTR